MSNVYLQDYHIGFSEVDFARQLKLSVLFNYFQDIASLAAADLGVGMAKLEQDYGVAWVLARIRVDLARQPVWNEDITIETWPLVPGKLEFERDFLVHDCDGNIIARAVSSWVIMDIQKRRLRRSDAISFVCPTVSLARAIDCQLGRIQAPGPLEVAYQRVIGYSDIDFNGHLNNSKFVDFIMDCFSMDTHQQSRVTSIEVSFTNEALPGDTVVLHRETKPQSPELRYIEGLSQQSGQVVFRAQLAIAAKS